MLLDYGTTTSAAGGETWRNSLLVKDEYFSDNGVNWSDWFSDNGVNWSDWLLDNDQCVPFPNTPLY
jgi:hypothetical protein